MTSTLSLYSPVCRPRVLLVSELEFCWLVSHCHSYLKHLHVVCSDDWKTEQLNQNKILVYPVQANRTKLITWKIPEATELFPSI